MGPPNHAGPHRSWASTTPGGLRRPRRAGVVPASGRGGDELVEAADIALGVKLHIPRLARDRPLADPSMARARGMMEQVLKAHEPYPALAVDRHWTMIVANAALPALLVGVDPELLSKRKPNPAWL